jgi:hypothetical protein
MIAPELSSPPALVAAATQLLFYTTLLKSVPGFSPNMFSRSSSHLVQNQPRRVADVAAAHIRLHADQLSRSLQGHCADT